MSPLTAINMKYGMHKGFVVENLVLSQLLKNDLDQVYCWQEATAEVDLVKMIGPDICPFEIKSSHRTRSKSLSSLISRYGTNPNLILSTNNFSKRLFEASEKTSDKTIYNIPLYLSEYLGEINDTAKLEQIGA